MVIKTNRNKIFDNRRVTLLSLIIVFGIIFYFLTNASSNKIRENKDNLAVVTNSKDFSNLAQYFISKIQSPYVDVKYLIKNNDSVEKILKNYDIRIEDIKSISTKLKNKKLSNIYSGRELILIFKKLDNNKNTVINLKFPISNTTSIEVRKVKENYIVKENILRLNKKEVV